MSTTIQLLRSSTPGAIPSAAVLHAGEIAVNTADGIAFMKKDSGAVVALGGVAAAGTLTGSSLASNIVASSLTSFGLAAADHISSTVAAGTGVTPTIQVICPSAAYTLASSTSAQNVFSSAYDIITLQGATTYLFEGQYILANGTTTHITAMSFVLGGASMTNCTWTAVTGSPTALNAGTSGAFHAIFNSVTGGNCNTTTAAANTVIRFQGIMRVNAGGTVVPQIAFSAAPGGTNQTSIGSYLKFFPIGSNTIDSVGTAIA